MKKQYIFLTILSVLIFGIAVPFIASADVNQISTTLNFQDVGSIPSVPEVPTISVLPNTTYTYTISLANNFLLNNDISKKISIVSLKPRLPGSFVLLDPVVCPSNFEEIHTPNASRDVGIINCIEVGLDTSSPNPVSNPQYDITYGQTGVVSFTFTTPSVIGTTDLSINVSFIRNDGLMQNVQWSPAVHIVVEIPTCNSWTYSDWTSCSADGTQTRDIVSSLPNSCTGGSPVLSQSCTYVPSAPLCIFFKYSKWSKCSPDGIQTRDVIFKQPRNCANGELPKITKSCVYTPHCDNDKWSCDSWNLCSLFGIKNKLCNQNKCCHNKD